ncbi:hypothetical protein IFM89_012809 [Coptis chinensis]|uniref:DYW domain-containing protein n=1 Tax=Coptis chinensis TaxID=261450 RepID=A0A835H600_9MAGN|nr:hypothetical protein IFM89_012809 [Coptis chinensis]
MKAWNSLRKCPLNRMLLYPELAEYAAGYLFELESTYSGNYILLANIYSTTRRWGDAARIRILMKDRGVTKPPSCNWIEVKRSVHNFIVGDTSHSLVDEISAKMSSLYSKIKEIGYVPDTKYVLQNLEEDEKEDSLYGHSEKMAIAFGLISTPNGTPLRIIKNLREELFFAQFRGLPASSEKRAVQIRVLAKIKFYQSLKGSDSV